MKKNTVLAQLLVFGTISIVVIGFAVFQLLGLRIINRPYSMTVQLANAGGIFESAEVNYRGVAVGRVDSMQLKTDGVTLTLKIDHGVKIPDNSIAHIDNLSAVGEQYLNFDPGTHPSSTYYKSGAVIPESKTTVPLRTAQVLYDLERFIDSVNPEDLRIIGHEGAAAFGDTGPQLKALLAGATQLVNELSSTKDATLSLLKNAALLLHGAAAHATQFDQFSQSLVLLSGTLASSTPTIEKFIEQSVPTTQLVNDLIRTNGNALTVLLANVASLSEIQVARIPGLRSLLVAVPTFGRLAPLLIRNNTLIANISIDQTQPLCTTGVPLTSPISGIRTPIKAVNCPASIEARGAQNAPRPGGASASSASSTAIGASALTTPDGSAQVGSYDASTGLTSTSDGQLYRLGTNGGQITFLGQNSWQALLLAGTGG